MLHRLLQVVRGLQQPAQRALRRQQQQPLFPEQEELKASACLPCTPLALGPSPNLWCLPLATNNPLQMPPWQMQQGAGGSRQGTGMNR